MGKFWQALLTLTTFGLLCLSPANANSQTWPLEQRHPFNAKIQQAQALDYHPLTKAQQAWRLCVLVPHLKDAYWIGIDYGLIQHAKFLGVSLDLFEAGSYYHQDKQLSALTGIKWG